MPKTPSMKVLDMAQAVAPNCQIECIGIRPGEKLHEVLLSDDEARNSVETEEMFVIQSAHSSRPQENWQDRVPVVEGFRYASDTNSEWLTAEDLYKLTREDVPPLSLMPNVPNTAFNYVKGIATDRGGRLGYLRLLATRQQLILRWPP